MIEQLRPREREILALLGNYTTPVSTYVLMDDMNYRSGSGILANLRTLENMGLLEPRQKIAGRRAYRAIILSEKGRELALLAKEAAQRGNPAKGLGSFKLF
jgi:hypothetical protein